MPATVRYDEQYCPVARALDVLGDRWTLLILREVMAGQDRFSDIRLNLPGITPGVLTSRIRTLIADGLLLADGSGKRPRYFITERGKDTLPVMRALAKFGMPILEAPTKSRAKRPWSALQTCVIAYYNPVAALGVDEFYLLRISGEQFTLSSRGTIEPRQTPTFTLDIPAATLFRIRKNYATLQRAITHGDAIVHGTRAAQKRFSKIFGF